MVDFYFVYILLVKFFGPRLTTQGSSTFLISLLSCHLIVIIQATAFVPRLIHITLA